MVSPEICEDVLFTLAGFFLDVMSGVSHCCVLSDGPLILGSSSDEAVDWLNGRLLGFVLRVEWRNTFLVRVLLLFVFLSGFIKVNSLSDQILTTVIDLGTLSFSLFSLILTSRLACNFLSWYKQSESMNQSKRSILERVSCNGCLCGSSCIHDKPSVKSARIIGVLCHWLFKNGAHSNFFQIKANKTFENNV